jgi:hypothetical protein
MACGRSSRRQSKFLPTPATGLDSEQWWKNRVKKCTGNMHVNHADDRLSNILLTQLSFFTIITTAVYVYVTLLSEAVMLSTS